MGHPQTVGDVMRRDFVTIAADESVNEALRVMRFARLRHLLVERGGVLVGILSYRDLQDQAMERLDRQAPRRRRPPLGELSVAKAMIDSPYAADPDLPLREAARRLHRLRIGCLPVVEASPDGPRLVGLISEADILGAVFEPSAGDGED